MASATCAAGVLERVTRKRHAQQRIDVIGGNLLRNRRTNDEHEFAACFERVRLCGKVGQPSAPHFLVQLGELAQQIATSRSPIASARSASERASRSTIRKPRAWRQFAQDRGGAGAARLFLDRQKSFEIKPVGGKSGERQRRENRRCAGQRMHRVAGCLRRAHKLEAGIGNERRAGIGHQCDGGALRKPGKQFQQRLVGVVVVIGRKRRGDAEMIDELAGDTGVLAGDEVAPGERPAPAA